MATAAVIAAAPAVISSLTSIFGGGAKRDAARKQRADYFGQSAEQGSLSAARYVLGGTQNTASHERPWYNEWAAKLATEQPALWAQAQQLGPLWGLPDVDHAQPAGVESAIRQELSGLVDRVRTEVAQTVQRIGAGVTDSATSAIAPAGSSLNQPLTIPTNAGTLALIAVGVLGLILIMRK